MSAEMIDDIGVLAVFATIMVLISVYFIGEVRWCNDGMRTLKQIHEELTADTATCAGCTFWDGDDGRCRNPNSRRFMQETEDGCERREGGA